MQQLRINGGNRLVGEVRASGAKNAALPILAAALLTADDLVLHNVPDLADVRTMLKLLEGMGVKVTRSGTDVTLNAGNVTSTKAPYELVKTMRASVLTLCPLAARFGSAEVSLPGGCAIGARPVDQHIRGLRQLGATVDIDHGYVRATAQRLKGAHIVTDMVTVTGTENLVMAAVLAEGETVIENAAREPEVVDLCDCLNAMGAHITGAGTPVISIEGVERLHGAEHTVIADRIEAGSFLVAGVVTQGDVLVTHCQPSQMEVVLDKLRAMGAWDNTLVLFLSDNGASAEIMVRGDGHNPQAEPGSAESYLCLGPGWSNAANTPFRRHKTWVHEGGIATPLIAHWPKGIGARGELGLTVRYLTPHSKWSIHSEYQDNLFMLSLSRGGPTMWMSPADAAKIQVRDNDWVEAVNRNGVLVCRAIVSHRMPAGVVYVYHAQERTIDVQVTRLRRKIEDDPKAPHHLQTVRGKGYVLWLN